ATNADDAHILRADVGVRIDTDRAHVDESAGFDDSASIAHKVQAFGERLRDARAVDDDIRPGVGVLAQELDPLFLAGLGGVDGQRRAEAPSELESRLDPVDGDQLAATHESRLDPVAEAKWPDPD